MEVENIYGSCEYDFESNYVHIYNLFVKPEFRLQGRARELLRAVIEEIKTTGHMGEIQIVAQTGKLKPFYESMGLLVFDYYG